jgi:hypothetical protein
MGTENLPRQELIALIKYGILLEDEFIEGYAKLIDDEKMLSRFKDNKDKAKEILRALVADSKNHKIALGDILHKY